jgi:hypothetical protein
VHQRRLRSIPAAGQVRLTLRSQLDGCQEQAPASPNGPVWPAAMVAIDQAANEVWRD